MIVADFAALVGTTSKTIYGKINNYNNLPSIEQLKTVSEKVKGREITVILTNSEQIEYYKNLYGKNTVNDSEYYETLTDNNSVKLVNEIQETRKITNTAQISDDMFERLMILDNSYNDRLERYNNELLKAYNELSEVKSKQLLLEDKAGREGFHLNEIKQLENDKKSLQRLLSIFKYLFITVTIILLLLITVLVTVNKVKNTSFETNNKIENTAGIPAEY